MDLLDNFDSVQLIIPRNSIEKLDYSELNGFLEKCLETPEALYKSHSILDVFIEGYDEDTRELYEIPEVVNWVNKSIYRGMPWFYFLTPYDESQGLHLIMLCYIATPEQDKEGCWKFEPDTSKINDFIKMNMQNLASFINDKLDGDEILAETLHDCIMDFYKKWLDTARENTKKHRASQV
jgi:hypothetical protein